MVGVIEMFTVNAYVTEVEPGCVYLVDVDGFEEIVTACKGVDDGVVTFKSALTRVLDRDFGDFDIMCCGVENGVCSYVVSIYDFVW